MKKFYQDFKLGVLGGGQLGRMLIQANTNFNVYTSVIDPDPNAPCKTIASEFQIGDIKDYKTVYNFGKTVDLLTIEIENVNIEALEQLEKEGIIVYPQPSVIKIIKDKRIQKQFYRDHNIPTADFILTENKKAVLANQDFLPAFQKLGTGGYDGGGVQRLNSLNDIEKAFDSPSLLEKLIDFDREISIVAARNADGEIKVFPTVELVFDPEYNLVDYLIAPSSLPQNIQDEAEKIAIDVVSSLGIVGILAVEMFVTKNGKVLVNEVAPRPHNSGHQTINANYTSQYEQHLRAILNLPLGATTISTPSAMVNLLGDDNYEGLAVYEGLDEVLKQSGVSLFLYGKKYTKPHRKMGHITIVDTDLNKLKEKVEFVKNTIKVIA